MDQHTFDDFVRRTAPLLDRRSLFGGASAALLAAAGLPLATEAKKGKHKKRNKNKKGKNCNSAKQCRRRFIPECSDEIPNCANQVRKCCKKACKSLGNALKCIDNIR